MDVRRGMAVTAMIGMLASMAAGEAESGRRVVNFNGDWRFAKGAGPQTPKSAFANPPQAGAEKTDFDASAWQVVRLPHDWAIAGPFNPRRTATPASCPGEGEGWYRKTFTLDQADGAQRVYFDFDGVMAFPQVYVNGQLAGQWDYGYMSFRVDATPFVKFGQTNTIAVHVDTRNHGTRWYPGAGSTAR